MVVAVVVDVAAIMTGSCGAFLGVCSAVVAVAPVDRLMAVQVVAMASAADLVVAPVGAAVMAAAVALAFDHDPKIIMRTLSRLVWVFLLA